MITSLTPWWYSFHDLIKCKDDNLQISLCPFPEIPHCWETSSVSVNALSSPSWFISDGVSASEAKRQYYGYIVIKRVNKEDFCRHLSPKYLMLKSSRKIQNILVCCYDPWLSRNRIIHWNYSNWIIHNCRPTDNLPDRLRGLLKLDMPGTTSENSTRTTLGPFPTSSSTDITRLGGRFSCISIFTTKGLKCKLCESKIES